MSARGGTIDAYGEQAQRRHCTAIHAIVTEEFVRAHVAAGGHTGPRWAWMWAEALFLLRHLRPGRTAEALFCHGALTGAMEALFACAGLIEPELAEISGHLAAYLEHGGMVREDGAWVEEAVGVTS